VGNAGSNAWSLCQTQTYELCNFKAKAWLILTWRFVRYTLQKSIGEVASCVADNAVKVDWLPQIQSYTGVSPCLDSNVYLIFQGIHILPDVLGTLFSVLVWPKMTYAAKSWLKFRRRWRKGKKEIAEFRGCQQLPKDSEHGRPSIAKEAASRPDFKKRYILKTTRLLQSIGREVLVAYLSVLVLAKSGFFGTSSFNEEISFYVVRPQPAPFLGLRPSSASWSSSSPSRRMAWLC